RLGGRGLPATAAGPHPGLSVAAPEGWRDNDRALEQGRRRRGGVRAVTRGRNRLMPTVALATRGCRPNQVDTQALQAALEARRSRPALDAESDDVVVVNACTVTARAEASDRQMIRRLARAHPAARLVVTGCWAQTDPERVAALSEVDLV